MVGNDGLGENNWVEKDSLMMIMHGFAVLEGCSKMAKYPPWKLVARVLGDFIACNLDTN